MNLKKEFDFKIGADPEFCIAIQNSRLNASNAIPHLIEDKYKTKDPDMGYDVDKAGNVGWDGCSATAEIRPSPAKKPVEIVANIARLFKAITAKTQVFSLFTTSQMETTGGHIHLEIDKLIANDNREMDKIHAKMATLFMPVIMGENSINIKKRLKGGYGSINDWRINIASKSPEKATYEFRCPTAEWLTTPKLANATLAYMGVIFHEVMNENESMKNINKILLKNKEQTLAIQQLTIANFLPLILSLHRSIKAAVRTFKMYPAFKDEVEYIFDFKRVLKDKEKANYDIMNGWKLNTFKKPNKRDLTSQIKLTNQIAKGNLEPIENAITIRHSSDINVELFARAIKQRIVAFNWKLKNKYMLFGLRNGIENKLVANANQRILIGGEMIKTKRDLATFKDLMKRVIERHYSTCLASAKDKENRIIFGIPYKERITSVPKIKNFIKTIYDIEKGKYKPQNIQEGSLIDDINNQNIPKGDFAKIMLNEIQTPIDSDLREMIKDPNDKELEETTDNNEEIVWNPRTQLYPDPTDNN